MRYAAFTAELCKLADTQVVQPQQELSPNAVTKARLIQGLKGALATSVGAGLGVGLGHLVLQKTLPHLGNLSPQDRTLLLGGTAVLGGAAGLAADAARRRYFEYVNKQEE